MKWGAVEVPLDVEPAMTVLELKQEVFVHTEVQPHRQKLLCKGQKLPLSDDSTVGSLGLKTAPGAPIKLMMMGTKEEDIAALLSAAEEAVDVVNDLDEEAPEELAIPLREENLQKLERRVLHYNIEVLNQPRPGKRLLVLDVDYTLFDHRSPAEQAWELRRPYVFEFLTAVYSFYDIVIWSATGMSWIHLKMREMGISTHPDFKLMCYLDSRAMISVWTPPERHGLVSVKPLAVIWRKFPEQGWAEHNSVQVDDLRRNFLMNPGCGLRIKPFRDAHISRGTDDELKRLAPYLVAIAEEVPDFRALDHRKWTSYLRRSTGKKRPWPGDESETAGRES